MDVSHCKGLEVELWHLDLVVFFKMFHRSSKKLQRKKEELKSRCHDSMSRHHCLDK